VLTTTRRSRQPQRQARGIRKLTRAANYKAMVTRSSMARAYRTRAAKSALQSTARRQSRSRQLRRNGRCDTQLSTHPLRSHGLKGLQLLALQSRTRARLACLPAVALVLQRQAHHEHKQQNSPPAAAGKLCHSESSCCSPLPTSHARACCQALPGRASPFCATAPWVPQTLRLSYSCHAEKSSPEHRVLMADFTRLKATGTSRTRLRSFPKCSARRR